MNQLTLQQYQKLAKKLNSWIGAEKARQKLIQYIRQNSLQAIEYTLKTLQQQENKKLLELTTTTILETLLDIPPETAQKYTAKYLEKQPQILQILLKDIITLAHRNKLEENKNTIQQEIKNLKPPAKTHLIAYMVQQNETIQQILRSVKIGIVKIIEKDLGGNVWRISWSPEGKYIAASVTSLLSNRIILLDKLGNEVWMKNLKRGIWSISWSPDGKYIAMSGWAKKVVVFDSSGNRVWESEDLGNFVSSVAWSPDGKYLSAGGYSKKIIVFGRFGNKIWEKELEKWIENVSWSPNGKYLAVCGGSGKVVVFDSSGNKLWESDSIGDAIWSVSWSPDGKYIAVGGISRKVVVFDSSGNKIWESEELSGNIWNIKWSPGGEYLAIGVGCKEGKSHGKVVVFDSSGNRVWESEDLGNFVSSVAWSPDGRYVAASGAHKKIVIFGIFNTYWNSLCESLSARLGYLCNGKWLDALGYYLLLRDAGFVEDAYLYGLGLLGLYSIKEYNSLRELPEGFIDTYLSFLVRTFYQEENTNNVVDASKIAPKFLKLLISLNKYTTETRLLNVKELINDILNRLNRKRAIDSMEYLEDIIGNLQLMSELSSQLDKYAQVLDERLDLNLGIDRWLKQHNVVKTVEEMETYINQANDLYTKFKDLYARVSWVLLFSGVSHEFLRSCLKNITGNRDIYNDIEYCAKLSNRLPRMRISINFDELHAGVWDKFLLHIINEEKLPIEISNVYLSRGFEVDRVEGSKCEGGGECDISMLVKPVEGGVVPTKLVLEGRILGVDKEFRIEAPIELHVSPVAGSVRRVAGSGMSVSMVSGLPGLDELFSLILRGFVDFVPGGRSYRVVWRENYTVGWTYDGSMDCIRLGCGGWGCSYLCRGVFGEAVLKVPLGFEKVIEGGGGETPTVSSRILKRIKDLAETLMALRHPGIIGLLGYGSRAPVLVYEYADQGTLAYQLDRGWRPTLRDILVIGLQLSDALRYIHSRGLVHGDVKPGNIFIKNGRVKLGDFSSLTRLLSRTSRRSRLTSCTPGYCAPEQLFIDLKAKAKEYGVENRVDVYQLGNLLLELMGLEPIDGSEILDTDLETTLEDIPIKELKPLLAKMLSYKPWERPSIEETEKTIYKTYTKTQ